MVSHRGRLVDGDDETDVLDDKDQASDDSVETEVIQLEDPPPKKRGPRPDVPVGKIPLIVKWMRRVCI
jgi:hypothetical protein